MTHPIENLMTKIQDLLVADSDVLALFKGGTKDIRYNIRPTRHDVVALPKPFISITESDDDLEMENTATRQPHLVTIWVEYYYDDSADITPLSEYAALEKIEAVLYGQTLKNKIAYGNDSGQIDVGNSGSVRIDEDGVVKRRYELTFKYYRHN